MGKIIHAFKYTTYTILCFVQFMLCLLGWIGYLIPMLRGMSSGLWSRILASFFWDALGIIICLFLVHPLFLLKSEDQKEHDSSEGDLRE